MQFWIFSTPSVLFSFSPQDTLRSPMSQYYVRNPPLGPLPPFRVCVGSKKVVGHKFGVGHRSTSLILLTLLPPSPTADSGNCSSNRRRRRSYVGVAEGGRVSSSSSSYFPSADMPERDAKSSSYNSDLRQERVALEKERERDKRGETNEATPFFLHGKFLYPLLFPLHTYYLCLPKLMVVLNGSLIVLYVQHHLT